MAREVADTAGVPTDLEGVREYLATLRADYEAHNHDGANSRDFQTLQVETLSARAISLRKTAYASATAGLWAGLSGTSVKFDLGDGTNYLRWDGSSLTITGSITGSTITGGTFRTAASGQRVVIEAADNVIKVYDSSAQVITIGTSLSRAIVIDLNSNTTTGIDINTSTDGTVGIRLDSSSNVTFNGIRIDFSDTGSGNDGYGIFIDHRGGAASSYCIDINKAGAGHGVRIISSSTGDALNISVSGATSGAALELNGNTSTRTVPLLNIDDVATASTGPGIRITSASTVCLDIVSTDANIGAIQIVATANSGSNMIGIRFNLANAGAGTEYAFEFAGSEYNASVTGVSGLTGAIKVLTSDGLVYIPVYGTVS